MTLIFQLKKDALIFILSGMMLLSFSSNTVAQVYLYQMPDGSRVVSDRAYLNNEATLVRRSNNLSNMGHYAARRTFYAKKQMRTWSYLISYQSKKLKIDEALVKAIIYAESYFNPNATSHKGASGLMQLMPATAQQYGVSDLYNPRQNIIAGIKHLKYLLKRYPKNLKHALAAYNAGETAINKYNGIPPYRETQSYVKKVMKQYKRYQLAKR